MDAALRNPYHKIGKAEGLKRWVQHTQVAGSANQHQVFYLAALDHHTSIIAPPLLPYTHPVYSKVAHTTTCRRYYLEETLSLYTPSKQIR